MVYVDTPFNIPIDHPTAPRCFLGGQSAHLMADSEQELITYARKIGMRDNWIQRRGTPLVHFDVTASRLTRVLKDPEVQKLSLVEIARRIREHSKAGRQPGDGE